MATEKLDRRIRVQRLLVRINESLLEHYERQRERIPQKNPNEDKKKGPDNLGEESGHNHGGCSGIVHH